MRISDWSSDVCSSDLETYEVGDQMSASLAPQYQTCARSPATCCAGLPRFQCRNRNRMRASKLQQTPEHAHVFHPCQLLMCHSHANMHVWSTTFTDLQVPAPIS